MRLFGRRKKGPHKRDLFTLPERPAFLPVSDEAAHRAFRMVVSDVFFITGRGVVATGTVEAGAVSVGNEVVLERDGLPVRTVEIRAIEQFRKQAELAVAGESVGLLFRDLTKGDVASGDLLRSP